MGVASMMDWSLYRPCHCLRHPLPPNDPLTTSRLCLLHITTQSSVSSTVVLSTMADRCPVSKTPAPTAADKDNKNNLRALAGFTSQVSTHVSPTHTVMSQQDNNAAMTYYGGIPTPTQASAMSPAISSALNSSTPPLLTHPGGAQPPAPAATYNLDAKEQRMRTTPPTSTGGGSGTLTRRPTPRYNSKGLGALSLSSLPGFSMATKTPSKLHGASKASNLKAMAATAARAAAADCAADAAVPGHSSHPGGEVGRAAAARRAAALAVAPRGAAAKVNAVDVVGEASKRGKDITGSKRVNRQTPDAAAAANMADAEAVAALLSLTANKGNLKEVLNDAAAKMHTHDEALHALAKAVGAVIVQQNEAPSEASRAVPPMAAHPMESHAVLLPDLLDHSQAKRHKAADGSVGVPPGDSTKGDVLPPPKPSLRVPPLTTAQRATIRHASEVAKKRVQGMLLMCTIRDDLTPKVKVFIGCAKKTMDVLPSPNIRHELIVESAVNMMKIDKPSAEMFLESIVNKPTKKRLLLMMGEKDVPLHGSTSNTTRVNAALHQAVHAVIGNLKRNVVSGWFNLVTGRSRSHMLPSSASYWLEENKFWKVPLGRKGIVAGLVRGFKYLGCSWRVRDPVNPGEELVGTMAMGHFCLAVQFIYEVLTNIKDGTTEDGGIDPSRYRKYVETVIKMDKELPKNCTEDRGIVLTDGDDPMRAVFEEEFMPVLPQQQVAATGLAPEGGEREDEGEGVEPAISAAAVGGLRASAAAAMRGGAAGAAAAVQGGGVRSVAAVGGTPGGAAAAGCGGAVGASVAVGATRANPPAALGQMPAITMAAGWELPAGAAVAAPWAAAATAPERALAPASALTSAASGAVARAAAKRAEAAALLAAADAEEAAVNALME